MATFLMSTGVAQEKKSKKEIKLEKKRAKKEAKFEASKKAMEIGQFGFGIRDLVSSNINAADHVFGIFYVRGEEGELSDVSWYKAVGEKTQLNADFQIENYTVVALENGQKMKASFQGLTNGERYSFTVVIAFDEKPTLKIKSGTGVEMLYSGLFETRN